MEMGACTYQSVYDTLLNTGCTQKVFLGTAHQTTYDAHELGICFDIAPSDILTIEVNYSSSIVHQRCEIFNLWKKSSQTPKLIIVSSTTYHSASHLIDSLWRRFVGSSQNSIHKSTWIISGCHKVAKTMELKLLQPGCKVATRLWQGCCKVVATV